ncbi:MULTISPECIES: hypothetical protein [Brevibacillus]|uniref:hypothetical protein n=1 Tax=Brevibacillus TaxID=55080 RepID=UPI002042113B|nr:MULTISPECIES: hypothetical protein [Brevibacillus]MCM3078146.1 hypothetical protein [Brevibacillus invocatus]MCM3428268.1 hypothetical protein [Brevibacillus invocatus]MDH4617615.1 hypothetical protein [Brevibacillus sp. AY1]
MKKNKLVIILLALVIIAALGYIGFRALDSVDLAEGYLYEEENLLLYAKVTNAEKIAVDVTEWKVESEQGIPVLRNKQEAYGGRIEDEKLVLQQDAEKTWSATFTKDELVFIDPVSDAVTAEARWKAATLATYEAKQKALEERIQQEAEKKKKEKALEEERVQLAKKLDQLKRLKADLLENTNYLNESQFSDETSVSQSHMEQMQGLLEEVKSYASSPSLHRVEFEVMGATVESMSVLRDGVRILEENIDRKKKAMTNLIEILESDLADLEKTWEAVKEEVQDAENQLKELEAVKTATTQALAQAEERIVASEKELSAAEKKADELLRQAQGLVNQTKEKHKF